MRLKFVHKAKKLHPTEIPSKMDFEKVLKDSQLLQYKRLKSDLLKSHSASLIVKVVTVGIVLTAVTLLIFDINLGSKNDTSEYEYINQQGRSESSKNESGNQLPATSFSDVENDELSSQKTINHTVSEPNGSVVEEGFDKVRFQNSGEENIFIQPKPLPDLATFRAFILNELTYPNEHLQNPIVGNVEVRFTLNEQGKAENFKIKKSLGALFDNEAIRVLNKYQTWQPATLNGEAVSYNLDISIRFEVK